MIGAVHGTVQVKQGECLLVMTPGVGYLVHVPARTLTNLTLGDKAFFHTYTHVREDQLQLYGFSTPEELTLFELLISVSGVGPKTALLVIDRGVEQVRTAVAKADVGFFTGIPRLGNKNAQKIIIELKTKLGSVVELDLSSDNIGETQELVEVLLSMGFSKVEAITAIKNMPVDAATLEQKINAALKMLGHNHNKT